MEGVEGVEARRHKDPCEGRAVILQHLPYPVSLRTVHHTAVEETGEDGREDDSGVWQADSESV